MIIFETERLIIRPFQKTDLNNLHKILSNPDVMKYYPNPLNKKETKEWIKRNWKRQNDTGHSLWAIIRKSDKAFIGQCGLVKQNVEGKEMIEVGYMIRNDCWRQGYALEAVRGVLSYAFNKLKINEVIALIDPLNEPSKKLAIRSGFSEKKQVHMWDKNIALFIKSKQ